MRIFSEFLKKIYDIQSGNLDGTTIWYNDSSDTVEERSDEWISNNRFFFAGKARFGICGVNGGNPANYTRFKEILDGKDGAKLNDKIRYASWLGSCRMVSFR